jgi:hypothetical protein
VVSVIELQVLDISRVMMEGARGGYRTLGQVLVQRRAGMVR